MKIQITMDDFPMSYLEMFKEDLKRQNIEAVVQVGGEDTVFVSSAVPDVVKAQILTILCDKYHFGGEDGQVLYSDEAGV